MKTHTLLCYFLIFLLYPITHAYANPPPSQTPEGKCSSTILQGSLLLGRRRVFSSIFQDHPPPLYQISERLNYFGFEPMHTLLDAAWRYTKPKGGGKEMAYLIQLTLNYCGIHDAQLLLEGGKIHIYIPKFDVSPKEKPRLLKVHVYKRKKITSQKEITHGNFFRWICPLPCTGVYSRVPSGGYPPLAQIILEKG